MPTVSPGGYLRVSCVYYTRTVGDKQHRVDENAAGDIARLRLNFVFEEFYAGLSGRLSL